MFLSGMKIQYHYIELWKTVSVDDEMQEFSLA